MSESVTATMATSQINQTTFRYSMALTNTGPTTVGTFWFAWDDVPSADFLISSPDQATLASPAGWAATITHGGAGDGYGILWTALAPAVYLQPGGTLGGFTFPKGQLSVLVGFYQPTKGRFTFQGRLGGVIF